MLDDKFGIFDVQRQAAAANCPLQWDYYLRGESRRQTKLARQTREILAVAVNNTLEREKKEKMFFEIYIEIYVGLEKKGKEYKI